MSNETDATTMPHLTLNKLLGDKQFDADLGTDDYACAFNELHELAKLWGQELKYYRMVEEQLDPSLHPIRAAFNALKTLGLASLWILDAGLKFLFVTQFELKKKQA